MSVAIAQKNTGLQISREELAEAASEGHLFALTDPFFGGFAVGGLRLELRDTDPQFYDMIAWERVTYEPPILAQLKPEALGFFLYGLCTERWGIFVIAHVSQTELARHLQRFVIARGPDGNPYFLRFHDAAVLEVLLRTWGEDERARFFGPVDAFGLPDLDSMDVRRLESPLVMRARKPIKPEVSLLDLRRGQLEACSEAIERDLIKVMQWHLRNNHGRAVQHLGYSELAHRVAVSITRARRYGFSTVSDLAGFSALMFELAPNFDEHPSFRRVLLNETIPAEHKLRRLSQVISEREWREAAERYDKEFWQRPVGPFGSARRRR